MIVIDMTQLGDSLDASVICISSQPHYRIGLEQELAMPDGSPVLDYLVDLKQHLSVGPPVMFVVNSTQLDYSDPAVQNALCGGEGCKQDSLQAQVP